LTTPRELTGSPGAGLRKNIDDITSNVLTNKQLGSHIERITNNFYSEIANQLAVLSWDLFNRTHNREVVTKFMDIAYSLECEWRAVHVKELLFCRLVNPDSLDTVDFMEIYTLDSKYASMFVKQLKSLPYREYLTTSYWKAIRRRMHRIYNGKCAHCEETQHLEVHHMCYNFLGEDHLHLDNLIVMCRAHHQRFHDIDNMKKQVKEKKWGKVGQ